MKGRMIGGDKKRGIMEVWRGEGKSEEAYFDSSAVASHTHTLTRTAFHFVAVIRPKPPTPSPATHRHTNQLPS